MYWEEYYKDGKKVGTWKTYDKDGKVWEIQNYKDGERHGLWKNFNDMDCYENNEETDMSFCEK